MSTDADAAPDPFPESEPHPDDPDTSGDWDTKIVFKSSVTGQFVTEEFAKRHPRTTQSMEVPEHATDIEPQDPADDDPAHHHPDHDDLDQSHPEDGVDRDHPAVEDEIPVEGVPIDANDEPVEVEPPVEEG